MLCSTESVFRLNETVRGDLGQTPSPTFVAIVWLPKTVDEHQIGVDARNT
jgi:hypothetical protein